MSSDSKAPVRQVKRVQFGILSPDEIVSIINATTTSSELIFVKILAPNVSHRRRNSISRDDGRW